MRMTRDGMAPCGKPIKCGACPDDHPCVLVRHHQGKCAPRHRGGA